MKALRVAQDIVPIGKFKTHAARVIRDLRDCGRPVVRAPRSHLERPGRTGSRGCVRADTYVCRPSGRRRDRRVTDRL